MKVHCIEPMADFAADLRSLLAASYANPAPLTAWEAAFLSDMQRRQRLPSEAQLAVLRRIAGRVDFASVNRAALARLPEVLARLLPGGKPVRQEWHAASLRGGAGDSLRVRLSGVRAGVWADFATGDKGGDVVSLAAAVAGLSQAEAARNLARMLGIGGHG
jgi:hypothetical protein